MIIEGDYLLGVMSADGEMCAMKVDRPYSGSYVLPAISADRKVVAVALHPIDQEGQYGIQGWTADGVRTCLGPGNEDRPLCQYGAPVCTYAETYTLTIADLAAVPIRSSYLGTEIYDDASDLNGNYVLTNAGGYADMCVGQWAKTTLFNDGARRISAVMQLTRLMGPGTPGESLWHVHFAIYSITFGSYYWSIANWQANSLYDDCTPPTAATYDYLYSTSDWASGATISVS